jgi:glutamate synthase domain-containing protein 1
MVKDSGNAVKYEPFLGLEERDACGVGFVANRNGDRSHDIVHKVTAAPVLHAKRRAGGRSVQR